MNDLLEQMQKLKPIAKMGVTLVVVLVLGGIYYSMFYLDMEDQMAGAQNQILELEKQKLDYQSRKQEYVAYRRELELLQEEQRELLKALPRRAEIPTFLANLQEQAELSGLEILKFGVEPEKTENLYVRIPVSMEIKGSYHRVSRFFKNIGALERIVNIQDLVLQPETTKPVPGEEAASPPIQGKFTASTYRFLEETERAATKGPPQ